MEHLNIPDSKINNWVSAFKGRVTKDDLIQEIYLIQLEADSGLNQLNSSDIRDKYAYIYNSLSIRLLGYEQSHLTDVSLDDGMIETVASEDNQKEEISEELANALSQLDILTNTDVYGFYNMFNIDISNLDRKTFFAYHKQYQRIRDRAIDNLITSTAISNGLSIEDLEALKVEFNSNLKNLKCHRTSKRSTGVKELA